MVSQKNPQTGKGGNAHQRAIAKGRQNHAEQEVAPTPSLPDPRREPLNFWSRSKSKRSDILALIGLLAGFGSWGYTALNPQPSITFGLVLIGLAGLCVAAIVIHLLECHWIGQILVVAATVICFWIFAKQVVIAPAFKHQFVSALESGYNLRNECGSRAYYEQTPTWMRDAQEQWKATVGTLLHHDGHADDVQLWSNSELVGLTSDSNFNGFRSTEMAIKTGALETIVARHYDPTIAPNPYTGPVYVFPQAPQPPTKHSP